MSVVFLSVLIWDLEQVDFEVSNCFWCHSTKCNELCQLTTSHTLSNIGNVHLS